MSLPVATDVPLAPLTTLELGGRARYFIDASDEVTVLAGLRWAAERGVPTFVIGGGSNLVVSDVGFDGLIIRMASRGIAYTPSDDHVLVQAQAGEPWDALVAETVRRNLAGVECLSGIPGLAGATPIQNVGAYGQDVAETIRFVRVINRDTLESAVFRADECGFAYRDSRFKREPDQHIVVAVTFALRPGGAPTVRYRDLEDALATTARPTLLDVRETVLRLRRGKSMVIDATDPNRRSVGSFFMNPIVSAQEAQLLVDRLVADSTVKDPGDVPQWAAGPGRIKLSAAWLIERAGLAKGHRVGAVGISTRHTLALVHHGGGTTADLLALAATVSDKVAARYGIQLQPEPVLLSKAGRIPM